MSRRPRTGLEPPCLGLVKGRLRMISIARIGVVLSLAALLTGRAGFAASCYEKSPDLVAQGDRYYDLEVVLPPLETQRAILSRAQRMTGKWEGRGTLLACGGSDEDPQPRLRQLQLTATVTLSPAGELRIDTKKYIREEKTWLRDRLVLFRNLAGQQLSLTADGFRVTEKTRPEADAKYRPLTEIRHTATRVHADLTYTIRAYTNGYLVMEEQWKLRPAR